MLFVGGRSLNWNISIHGTNDKDETHIMTVGCKEKYEMDVICMMKRIERRLLVDLRVDLRNFLVPFFDANSALQRQMPRTRKFQKCIHGISLQANRCR